MTRKRPPASSSSTKVKVIGDGADGDVDNEDAGDVDNEDDGDALGYDGLIVSFSAIELVLEGGLTFLIDDSTNIKGTLSVGAPAEVKAVSTDGGLLATKITVEDEEEEEEEAEAEEEEGGDYIGTIVSFSAIELVLEGGLTFLIDDSTNIKGMLLVGHRQRSRQSRLMVGYLPRKSR